MNKKFLMILIVLFGLIALNAVNASDINQTNVVSSDEGQNYDKIVDHRLELEQYKKRPYASYTEVQDNSIFQKTFDDGVTIKIINKNGERKYYWIENGITWTKKLNLGLTNVNKDGLTLSHVILHGNIIKNEKQPIYKIVKKDKKVIKNYKKKLVKKIVWTEQYQISPKSYAKDLKKRILNYNFECCSRATMNIVRFFNLHEGEGFSFKLKVVKAYKEKARYSPQYGCKIYPIKFKIIIYKKKPIYKNVKVNAKVIDHYKYIRVLHKY